MFNSLDCFYVVNKTLWLKTRADMYAKISMFVICVEAIIYLLLYNLHISIKIFCILFICFVLDGLRESICCRMFFSKHSITF